MATAQTDTATPKAATLAAWKKSKLHYVTLPSATVVGIEIPDLPQLIKTGSLPNELLDAAIREAEGEGKKREITREDIIERADFYNKLCVLTVKEPTLSEEDAAGIPFEDKEMVVEFATRQRDLDAIGHHLGGLEKVKDFRKFRGISSVLEDLGDE